MTHRCEAMVPMNSVSTNREMYVMCGRLDADLHHKLTRARGGLILDSVKETYHLMYLCREHHAVAHDEGKAFDRGLLIRGSVTTGPKGEPMYTGPDPYLTEMYSR